MVAIHPLELVLGRLDGVRECSSGYESRCPAHDDHHASLSVSLGDDGRVLVHCHAGCQPADVCKSIGLRLRDLFPSNGNGHDPGNIVATYDYRDADGNLLFQLVRFEGKQFRQRRPNVVGGWTWKLGRTPRVLYRLRELLAADPSEWVFIVEGEKDVDRLVSQGLAATCNPGGAKKWKTLSDDSALNDRRIILVPDKDEAGWDHVNDVGSRLYGRVSELRILELSGGGKDVSDWFDVGGTKAGLLNLAESAPAWNPTFVPRLPNILIDTKEHRVAEETIAALTADPDLYQRGGILVRLIRDRQPTDGILRCEGSATIQAMPAANLRERMTRCATFSKLDRKGDEVAAHPTLWLVGAVEARAEWSGIRRLVGVSETPILRPDGSILQTPGYDNATGVLYEPQASTAFPAVHPEVGYDDADVALGTILEPLCDFPFEAPEHRSAWLAAFLTPLARFAFAGPSPLFLFDANVRGVGKTLLGQIIGRTVLGREMPVSSYVHDSNEMRKKFTAIALAGDRLVLFDNLEGRFGNDALDRALTSTRWKDRILGRSEEVDLPLFPCWYATGNNVQIAADTMRRVIHIRLDCLDERPEERSGFRHEHLLTWVNANRGALLSAGLTILSAFLRNGSTSQLIPFGSFEGWSDVVRQAIVWLGQPDPCLTRVKMALSADVTVDAVGQLLAALRLYRRFEHGFVVSELLKTLYPSKAEEFPQDDMSVALRGALENFVNCPPGKTPQPRHVGNRLRSARRRVIDGCYLDVLPERNKRGVVWQVMRVGETG